MRIIDFIKNLFRKKIENTNYGLIDSPQDFRDIPLEAISPSITLTPIRDNYEIPYQLTVKDQTNTPMCVGYATSTLEEDKQRDQQNFLDFDPVWIYQQCKKIDNLPNVEGTYFRAGLSVLKNVGAMSTTPDDTQKYRIMGYVSVPCNFDDIKRAIYQHGVLLAGFKGSNNGWQTSIIKQTETQWSHAVALVGYDKDRIKFQNSWGNWGDKGYGYFTKDYLPYEVWAIISVLPSNWQELLPPKDKPVHTFLTDLFYGQTNDEIKILQNCLKFLGCLNKSQESTGYFGDITREAVISFQTRYGLTPPAGYVGRATRAKLNDLFKGQ